MTEKEVKLGLRENWQQFFILVLINIFVGGMVGIERTIMPAYAESVFHVSSRTAILSFIVAFGLSKAIANLYTGKWSDRLGRKNLLIIGWILALPIPWILMWANHWYWVVASNMLLGISQGLTWSSTVFMKIDLVGQKNRGLAMGINEFAGYVAVGIMAYVTGYLATRYGVSPYPFMAGIFLSVFGLITSIFFLRDTRGHLMAEEEISNQHRLTNIFRDTTFRHKTLSAVTQAGFVNNLNDGMIWGLLPLLLMGQSFDTTTIGIITAIYPMVWGFSQLFTGKWSDHASKKSLLFWGMLMQGICISLLVTVSSFWIFVLLSFLLGFGTAMVYPTFLSVIAGVVHPAQRAASLGVFRFWRDGGYAVGALVSGIIADIFGIEYAILSIGLLTILSALIIVWRMPE